MKSNNKFNETPETANLTDFPLILCGNGPKGTKTMQTQKLFSRIEIFFFENVVVFVAIIFNPELWLVKLKKRICGEALLKKRHCYNFAFQAC